MIPKKTKEATLPLSASMLAMAVMFATNQAHVTRVPHEGGIDLVFNFAARQQFMVTFHGERLVAASLTLVEGRVPSTEAMSAVDSQTTVDTVELFSGLESNGVLRADVVTDEGFNFDKRGVDTQLVDVAKVDATLGDVFKKLLDIDADPDKNLGDLVETLRAQLAAKYRPQPQTQAKSQEAA